MKKSGLGGDAACMKDNEKLIKTFQLEKLKGKRPLQLTPWS
jgi:hypothetical protein